MNIPQDSKIMPLRRFRLAVTPKPKILIMAIIVLIVIGLGMVVGHLDIISIG